MIKLLELLDEESEASKQAKAQGLEYIGFGRYGKDGKVTHISKGGKLVPTGQSALRPGVRPTTKDKLYKKDGSGSAVAKLDTSGKPRRIAPKWTPDVNKQRNEPQDALKYSKTTDRIKEKVWDKVSSTIEDGETLTRDQILQRTGLPEKALNFGLKTIESDDVDYAGFVDNGDGTYTINHGN